MLFHRLVSACIGAILAFGQAPSESKPTSAIEAIISRFDQFPIVILCEIHGSIQFDQLLKEAAAASRLCSSVGKAASCRSVIDDAMPTDQIEYP